MARYRLKINGAQAGFFESEEQAKEHAAKHAGEPGVRLGGWARYLNPAAPGWIIISRARTSRAEYMILNEDPALPPLILERIRAFLAHCVVRIAYVIQPTPSSRLAEDCTRAVNGALAAFREGEVHRGFLLLEEVVHASFQLSKQLAVAREAVAVQLNRDNVAGSATVITFFATLGFELQKWFDDALVRDLDPWDDWEDEERDFPTWSG